MRYEKHLLEKLVNESNSYSEVARKLGLNASYYGNRQTVKKYIELFSINSSHFGSYGCGNKSKKRIILNDVLIKNSTYRNTTGLKKKLYSEGLKQRICEMCGQGEEWNGKKISLILDHINGENTDNRIENLRIVCPNCAATLETHCKGHKRLIKKLKTEKKTKTCECGNLIYITSERCRDCSNIKQQKVERPNIDILKKDVNEIGYVKTGKKYSVSDNTIRKWIKKYEK